MRAAAGVEVVPEAMSMAASISDNSTASTSARPWPTSPRRNAATARLALFQASYRAMAVPMKGNMPTAIFR
ncbi:hypothetical protein D3C73_1495620 [compost metagenome]